MSDAVTHANNQWLRTRLLLGAILFLLTACGVKSGYNKLDWLITAYVDDYVTLDTEQRSLLQRQLNAQLSWHRQEQLPRYACWIARLRTDLVNGLTTGELEGHDAELRTHWHALMRRLAPDFMRLLATASDTQIDELRANFERKTKKYKSKYVDLPAAERHENRSARMKKRLKRWTGPLTAAQEQAVDAWSERIELSGANRLAYRQQWQVFLTELGAARHDSARLATNVERILANPQAEQSPEYRRQREINRIETKHRLIQIDSLLEPQQREYLQEQLWELAHDFSELSGVQYHRLSCAVQDAPVPRRPGTVESGGRAGRTSVPYTDVPMPRPTGI